MSDPARRACFLVADEVGLKKLKIKICERDKEINQNLNHNQSKSNRARSSTLSTR
eukprot:SAG31_NODE_647_length_13211_cov_10.529362_4_plen_54_part_01